jgi:hypothetical protein
MRETIGAFLRFVAAIVGLALFLLCCQSLWAQATGTMLSGTVADASGKALPNPKVTAKNQATGQTSETQTDSSGHYSFSNLPPGDYQVSASAESQSAGPQTVTLAAGVSQILNLTQGQPAPAPANENLPNAPAANQTTPSLADLGFSPAESKANDKEQALLDRRTHLLKIHQRMGLITTIPMIATVVTSLNAGGKSEGTAARDLHVALGAVTGDLYGITAYYALRAPRIRGTKKRGPIRFHEAMAWIHGPGMIATPILGAMAFSQKNNGEKVHGAASAHGPVAIVTAGAFGAALLSVSLKF